MKKCHGAIEGTTLSQAEAINKNGVYRVGNLTNTPLLENPVGHVNQLSECDLV